MAPRKRQRLSQATSPSAPTKTRESTVEIDPLDDPWTDEEEIGLFKGVIKWKPTGIHKHFRMLQLREYLLENKFINPRSQHTQIPGIWDKLRTLYDLEALDQREDARQLSEEEQEEKEEEDGDDDVYSEAANKVHKQSFELPDDEYSEAMWQQRLANEDERGKESPPTLPELNLAEQPPVEFTPSMPIDIDTATPASRPRGRPKGSTKSRPSATTRRSRRGADADEPSSDAEEDPADEEEEEDDNDDEEEEEADDNEPASKGRASRKGRPPGRRRARGKGK